MSDSGLKQKKPFWLILISVIFFPITILVLTWRSKKLHIGLRIGISVIVILVIIAAAVNGRNNTNNNPATPVAGLSSSDATNQSLTPSPSTTPSSDTNTSKAAALAPIPTTTPAPSPVSTPSATINPSSSKTPEPKKESKLELISITSPIDRNETATIKVKGSPNTEYDIDVFYSSSESSADGLENKTSDKDGYVSWSWKIGGKTKEGEHHLVVKGSSETLKVKFTVK